MQQDWEEDSRVIQALGTLSQVKRKRDEARALETLALKVIMAETDEACEEAFKVLTAYSHSLKLDS